MATFCDCFLIGFYQAKCEVTVASFIVNFFIPIILLWKMFDIKTLQIFYTMVHRLGQRCHIWWQKTLFQYHHVPFGTIIYIMNEISNKIPASTASQNLPFTVLPSFTFNLYWSKQWTTHFKFSTFLNEILGVHAFYELNYCVACFQRESPRSYAKWMPFKCLLLYINICFFNSNYINIHIWRRQGCIIFRKIKYGWRGPFISFIPIRFDENYALALFTAYDMHG